MMPFVEGIAVLEWPVNYEEETKLRVTTASLVWVWPVGATRGDL